MHQAVALRPRPDALCMGGGGRQVGRVQGARMVAEVGLDPVADLLGDGVVAKGRQRRRRRRPRPAPPVVGVVAVLAAQRSAALHQEAGLLAHVAVEAVHAVGGTRGHLEVLGARQPAGVRHPRHRVAQIGAQLVLGGSMQTMGPRVRCRRRRAAPKGSLMKA